MQNTEAKSSFDTSIQPITEKEFNNLRDFMYSLTGVALPPSKKSLIFSRLRKKLETLKFTKFEQYYEYLKQPNRDAEIEYFINAITTNETYFFRHTKQFNYLHDVLFPSFIANQTNFPKKEVSIWSAASSTGEEPYSLGITCKHFFQNNPSWHFKLYASDINTDVIQQAKEGVYNERAVKYVPDSFKKKFFTQEILDQGGINQKKYKISSEIKKIVEFRQHNLLKRFPVDNINIIFIRNVMIYFDKQTKTKVFNNFFDVLAPKGYIFISLSESLSEFEPKIKSMGTAIYQKV